jgi:hypothetical protein
LRANWSAQQGKLFHPNCRLNALEISNSQTAHHAGARECNLRSEDRFPIRRKVIKRIVCTFKDHLRAEKHEA